MSGKIIQAKNRDYAGSGGTQIIGLAPNIQSAEAIAFLARTSGLNSLHTAAYTDLINRLVANGIWSLLDALYIFATQDSTTALLNLVSGSYNGTTHGSPTFTADQGFTGVDGSSTKYIDTGFDPFLASSPKYVRDSAHISAWSLNSAAALGGSSGCIIGAQGSSGQTNIFPRYNDDKAYFRVNGSGIAGVSNTDGKGHFVANRSSSSAIQGYRNKVSVGALASDTSHAVDDDLIYVLANNNNGAAATGFGGQVAMASIGAHLSSTNVSNLYDPVRDFLTTVGIA